METAMRGLLLGMVLVNITYAQCAPFLNGGVLLGNLLKVRLDPCGRLWWGSLSSEERAELLLLLVILRRVPAPEQSVYLILRA